jgi:HEAT repeat protein
MDNVMTICTDDEIDQSIEDFEHPDWFKRQEARGQLAECGKSAVDALIKALKDPDQQIRWESAKTLGIIQDPTSARALVESMMDDDVGVRWTAMESLINLRRASVTPILEALTRDFGSATLREGAHHVLNELKAKGVLTRSQIQVLKSLEDVDPEIECAWAAERALEASEFSHMG